VKCPAVVVLVLGISTPWSARPELTSNLDHSLWADPFSGGRSLPVMILAGKQISRSGSLMYGIAEKTDLLLRLSGAGVTRRSCLSR
jgi:hypothetical protein